MVYQPLIINLTRLRKKKGISQDQMADDLGITRSRLSSWEEYRANPPVHMLPVLSQYFKVTIDSLFEPQKK